jgi:hypothetical protein
MNRLLLALFAALVATSCANVPADYKFDAAKDDGLIVGSITYDSSIGRYSLIAVPSGASKPSVMSVGYSQWPPLGPLNDDALKARGGTYAVAAPAGSYRVVGWEIRQGAKITRNSAPIDVPFTVEKGKASYLGNLHFSQDWDVSLRDRSARDLPVLQARYEALKQAPLQFTIAKDVNIEKLGGDYRSQFQIPIFIPIAR